MFLEPFPITSRYYGVEATTRETPAGKTIAYLRRRFVPAPDRFTLLQEHSVAAGERLDHIAAQHLGDPEQFWRICDANNSMRPEDLTVEIGPKIRITLPEGISGTAL